MSNKKQKYVVKYSDGERLWGPFPSADDAAEWSRDNMTNGNWIIVPLADPDGF